MSAIRRSARRGPARLVAAAVLGALAAMALATPAQAEDGDVRVSLNNLTSSLNAGRNEDFTVRTENKTDQALFPVRRIIVVELPGLGADQVTVSNRRLGLLPTIASEPGKVSFGEVLPYRLGADGKAEDSVSATFTIRFDQSAPAGQVTVTAFAVHDAETLGSDSDTMILRSSGVAPTSTPPSAPPTTVPPPTQGAGQSPVVPFEPGKQAGLTSNSGIPSILYVLGALLLAIGGLILWLLFRGQKPALVEGYGRHPQTGHLPTGYAPAPYEQVRPPSLGYPSMPASGANLNPTTVMPAVTDPMNPPPAVDPWAPGGDGTERFPGPRH